MLSPVSNACFPSKIQPMCEGHRVWPALSSGRGSIAKTAHLVLVQSVVDATQPAAAGPDLEKALS